MTTRVFGSGIRRREDPRLITGRASYTDDIKLPGIVHAAILRSPYAHATIKSIDTSGAAGQPGVVAVYTGEDTEGALNGLPCAWLIPNSDLKTPTHPAIAKDRVRYVGDAVAVVVAESRYEAEDALEHIEVEYEPLGVVINPKDAAQDGAPQLHDDVPNNIAFTWAVAGGDTDAAFAEADVTVSDTITLQRLIANPMEPRSAVAQWVDVTGDLTLWSTSQNPHIARFLTSVVTGGAGTQDTRDRAGGWRRLREQDSVLPGRGDHRVLFDASGRAGEMDGDSKRELSGDDPGPRSRRRG